jgi:hypothetical protein
MLFLHIDPKNNTDHSTMDNTDYNIYDSKYKSDKKLTDLLNEYMSDNNKNLFIFFYMEGCGPCGQTKPEWKKIKNVLSKKYDDNVVIVDIDQVLTNELKNLKSEPVAFPTIRFISNGGKIQEDFEDSEVENKERSIDAFVDWINLKSSQTQNGGKKRRSLKEKITRRISRIKTRKNKRGGKWSLKYKRSINCKRPKGFSQKQYCKYSRKK